MLILIILPELDVIKGAMLLNSMCIIPGILNALTRDPTEQSYLLKLILDILSISAQFTAFLVWPIALGQKMLWCIPFACLLVSLGWWENYLVHVDKQSSGKNYKS